MSSVRITNLFQPYSPQPVYTVNCCSSVGNVSFSRYKEFTRNKPIPPASFFRTAPTSDTLPILAYTFIFLAALCYILFCLSAVPEGPSVPDPLPFSCIFCRRCLVGSIYGIPVSKFNYCHPAVILGQRFSPRPMTRECSSFLPELPYGVEEPYIVASQVACSCPAVQSRWEPDHPAAIIHGSLRHRPYFLPPQRMSSTRSDTSFASAARLHICIIRPETNICAKLMSRRCCYGKFCITSWVRIIFSLIQCNPNLPASSGVSQNHGIRFAHILKRFVALQPAEAVQLHRSLPLKTDCIPPLYHQRVTA